LTLLIYRHTTYLETITEIDFNFFISMRTRDVMQFEVLRISMLPFQMYNFDLLASSSAGNSGTYFDSLRCCTLCVVDLILCMSTLLQLLNHAVLGEHTYSATPRPLCQSIKRRAQSKCHSMLAVAPLRPDIEPYITFLSCSSIDVYVDI
jgi:hypothetical protein